MPQAAELVIVRHGEAWCDTTGTVGGPRSDAGLTVTGRTQSAYAAIRLVTEPDGRQFAAVYSGSRPRLRETARILATILGATPRAHKHLAEQRYGDDADGRAWLEVIGEFGGIPACISLLSLPDAPRSARTRMSSPGVSSTCRSTPA